MEGKFDADSVLREKQLIEMFDVSKTTLREALVELCTENILENLPRYGYRVIKLTEKDVEDAQEVRLLIELNGFDKVVAHFDENIIQTLKEYNKKSDENRISGKVFTHWENNVKFHLLLNSYADNSWMNDMLKRTLEILGRSYAQSYWDRWGNRPVSLEIDTHNNIVSYLEKKEFDLAKEWLEKDIRALKIY